MPAKLRKKKVKVASETSKAVVEPELLEVNVDPIELRADQAVSRAAEDMELRQAAEKKAEASDRQVEALQLRLRQLLEEKAKQREQEQRAAEVLRARGSGQRRQGL